MMIIAECEGMGVLQWLCYVEIIAVGPLDFQSFGWKFGEGKIYLYHNQSFIKKCKSCMTYRHWFLPFKSVAALPLLVKLNCAECWFHSVNKLNLVTNMCDGINFWYFLITGLIFLGMMRILRSDTQKKT